MAGPLGAKDLSQIQTNLDRLNLAEDEIKLAEQAGLDVSAFREQARTQRAQLLKIKQTYFPGE